LSALCSLILAVGLAGRPAVSALPPSDRSSELRVPDPDEVLRDLTKKSHQNPQLPPKFSLLTWNIQKASDGAAWAKDLNRLSKNADLVLLQEAVSNNFMTSTLENLKAHSFLMAQSFFYNDGNSTGVATGSKASLEGRGFRQSPAREPITKTPKLTLMTVYQMQDRVPVLVLNIHGINFVSNTLWRQQLEDLRPYLLRFSGRVIFAGDFNTWNPGRTEFLESFAAELGLQKVHLGIDERRLKLDHIFLRGCTAAKAKLHSEIKTSDHLPLKAEIICDPKSVAPQPLAEVFQTALR
jgi:endonuclease/exonuclease/phosphatase (EEP) superfamily protein YafD